jgi:hypothetical protein
MSPKSYYARAKAFGVMMVVVAITVLIYYLFPELF